MNLIVLSVAGAALVTSLVAVNGPASRPLGAVYQPEPSVMKAEPAAKSKPVRDVSFSAVPLRDALDQIAAGAGLKAFVHWEGPGSDGLGKDDPVTLVAHDADLDRLFDILNEARTGSKLDYRVVGGHLEVATREFFDKRDSQLVSFDIAAVISQGVQAEALLQAISSMVEPESWVENGGAAGTMTVVGNRLFIKAPPRLWKKAAWMIEQLGGEASTELRLSRNTRPATDLRTADLPLLSSLLMSGKQARAAAIDRERLQADLSSAEAALVGARVNYGPDHKAVRDLQARVDAIKAQINVLSGPHDLGPVDPR